MAIDDEEEHGGRAHGMAVRGWRQRSGRGGSMEVVEAEDDEGDVAMVWGCVSSGVGEYGSMEGGRRCRCDWPGCLWLTRRRGGQRAGMVGGTWGSCGGELSCAGVGQEVMLP